jgi:hypothetical protein
MVLVVLTLPSLGRAVRAAEVATLDPATLPWQLRESIGEVVAAPGQKLGGGQEGAERFRLKGHDRPLVRTRRSGGRILPTWKLTNELAEQGNFARILGAGLHGDDLVLVMEDMHWPRSGRVLASGTGREMARLAHFPEPVRRFVRDRMLSLMATVDDGWLSNIMARVFRRSGRLVVEVKLVDPPQARNSVAKILFNFRRGPHKGGPTHNLNSQARELDAALRLSHLNLPHPFAGLIEAEGYGIAAPRTNPSAIEAQGYGIAASRTGRSTSPRSAKSRWRLLGMKGGGLPRRRLGVAARAGSRSETEMTTGPSARPGQWPCRAGASRS